MTANMYRVGDYVYFEATNSTPYYIRRIEELNKAPNGNVEAKVMCFFRRRDLPTSLVILADKHQQGSDEDTDADGNNWATNLAENDLTKKQKYQLKHRELFLSRRVETLPAASIRGKCCVTLLNETESLLSYINTDDMFFYCLVFDPLQKTLLADKGEIRVGIKYQADIPPILQPNESDPRPEDESLDTLMWTSSHNVTDRQIDQFLVISRSVGTFARSLDCSSSVKQPSLHMSAAAASRDITLFHAMDTLHKHNYNLSTAISSLVPSTGPVLCRDEMEEWSASEANLFEEALEKYGKDFIDIRRDFIPWKTLKNIVEYYYMWKTTDRYVQQKRVKAVEAESKLKQVYVPNYAHKGPQPGPPTSLNNKNMVNGTNSIRDFYQTTVSCEVCSMVTNQWYLWNMSGLQSKVCYNCWMYWKKYGGFKYPHKSVSENDVDFMSKKKSDSDDEKQSTHHRPYKCSIMACQKEFKLKAHLARHYATAHSLAVRTGSPRPIVKTRTAFYLHSSFITRASRRLCSDLISPRHVARKPFLAINVPAIKQECQIQLTGKSLVELKELLKCCQRDRGSVTVIATRLALLGNYELIVPDWLAPTKKDKLPKSDHVAFPKPPKGPDGSLLYERIPNAIIDVEKSIMFNNLSPAHKRRAYEEMNGIVIPQAGPPSKRVHKEFVPAPRVVEPSVPSPITIPAAMSVPTTITLPTPTPLKSPVAMSTSLASSFSVAVPTPLVVPNPATMLPHGPVALTIAMPSLVSPVITPSIIAAPSPVATSTPTVSLTLLNGGNFKSRGSIFTRTGRKQLMSWMDAPDDLYFRSTVGTRNTRRLLSFNELRRAARRPWKNLLSMQNS